MPLKLSLRFQAGASLALTLSRASPARRSRANRAVLKKKRSAVEFERNNEQDNVRFNDRKENGFALVRMVHHDEEQSDAQIQEY